MSEYIHKRLNVSADIGASSLPSNKDSNDNKEHNGTKVFRLAPDVKKKLWGRAFWTSGYFASTVGKHGDENMILDYVKNQCEEYVKLYEDH